MKKFTCLMLSLLLCLASVAAFAESIPSKTAADLTSFDVTAESLPANSGFFLRTVKDDETDYQKQLDICKDEIAKLAAAETVEAYFGDETLKEKVGVDKLNVFEFAPVIAGGYDKSYGKVTAKMLFSTPYEKDEKVVVMIGMVSENTDGTYAVEWTAYEGKGIEADANQVENLGRIEVEFDPVIVAAIQDGTALLAIVSD